MSPCASRATTDRPRPRVRFPGLAAGLCLGLLAAAWTPPAAYAYETDPFSNRLMVLQDSAPALDREVNRTIADIVAHWRGPADQGKFVDAIFHRIGGYYWVDHLEHWAMKSPEVEKLPTPRFHSFYRKLPLYASRVSGVFGIGPSFRVGSSLIGSDKIGHFLSQGRKFWRRWKKSDDETQAAKQSAFTERAIFGALTTGTYSNADLVANYEGYRFYRSLFEDGVVAGKPAILRWDRDHWTIQREFTWTDHVNDYWDEGLDINNYDRWMTPAVQKHLHDYCDDWRRDPARYAVAPDEDAALAARYAMLQLKLRPELRLAAICGEGSS